MKTCDCVSDLGQVDLVVALRVAGPVLPPVRRCIMRDGFSLKLLEGAVPVHLKIDADPAVEGTGGDVEIQVGDACLDDHGYHFARGLVVRDPDLDRVLCRDPMLDACRKSCAHRGGQLEELVGLPAMFVHDRDTRGLWPSVLIETGCFGVRLDDEQVEVVVEGFVLSLGDTTSQ